MAIGFGKYGENGMIHVTLREIEEAFRKHKQHRDLSSSLTMTDKMVLFYAVECGLKWLYMRKHRLKRTDQADSTGKSVTDFGHNLNSLLEKNGFSYTIPKITAKDSTQIEADSLHQAWRYGKSIEEEKEKDCLKKLNRIFNELKNKLNGG